MMNRVPLPPAGFDDLPVEDQIDYVQSLWDRIAANLDQVPVPEWHRGVLAGLYKLSAPDRAAADVSIPIHPAID
jgi:hypothetical protein